MEGSPETSPSSTNSSDELSSALQLSKGMSIFLDILRRADKNDDGKLSFEEFKAYFADGVLSGEELHELFHTIDTHNTNFLAGGGGVCGEMHQQSLCLITLHAHSLWANI